jgi:cytidylate kinase
MKRVIGLSGTNGAGKDTVGHLLASHYGYLFVSMTDMLREECKRRGLPIERHNLRMISAEWRREKGYGVLIDMVMDHFEPLKDQYRGVVMASLRNPHEADRLHDFEGVLVWVDADPKVRYERIQSNAASRGRQGEDDKTFEQFLAEEQVEMHNTGDEAELNMSAVRDRSDIVITNDTTDVKVLTGDVETALALTV